MKFVNVCKDENGKLINFKRKWKFWRIEYFMYILKYDVVLSNKVICYSINIKTIKIMIFKKYRNYLFYNFLKKNSLLINQVFKKIFEFCNNDW